MSSLFLRLAWALIALSLAPAALAQAPEQRHIATRFIAETDAPAAGSLVSLAIQMTPEPGWHGYWKNPGDSGIEPPVKWTLPSGAAAGPLEYPVPERLIVGGLMNYVYEGPYALLLKLKVRRGLPPEHRSRSGASSIISSAPRKSAFPKAPIWRSTWRSALPGLRRRAAPLSIVFARPCRNRLGAKLASSGAHNLYAYSPDRLANAGDCSRGRYRSIE